MSRFSPPQLLVGAAAAVLLVASLVGLATRDGGDGDGAAAAPGSVRIVDFTFDPGTATVPVGSTVVWTNEDDFPHTVTSQDGGPLDSGELAGQASFETTFDQAGTFAYLCTLHPNMQGVVEVTG